MGYSFYKPTFVVASMAAASLITTAIPAYADETHSGVNVSAELNFGLRNYFDDGLFAGQSDSGVSAFWGLNFNGSVKAGPGDFVLQFKGLMDNRTDRTYINLEKLQYKAAFDSWDVLVGYHVENWGVAESSTIMNVLNSTNRTDPTTNIGAERIGTPMINVNFQTGIGAFSIYGLLDHVQPHFGDSRARDRALFETNTSRAFYEGNSEDDIDIALRYSNNFTLGKGSLDFSAMYFNGTSRDPVLLPGCINTFGPVTEIVCNTINTAVVGAYASGALSGTITSDQFWDFMEQNATDAIVGAVSAIPAVGFIPYYQDVEKTGATLVYSNSDLQLRFEGIYQNSNVDEYFATVIGGDYTWNNFAGKEGSLTLAIEYLYDERGKNNPFIVFEDDIFIGVNYRLNNTLDTRFSLGGFIDLDSSAQLYTLSASTRVNDSIRVELNATTVSTSGYNDPLAFIANDNFVEMNFIKYF
jgi:hypothetical protein